MNDDVNPKLKEIIEDKILPQMREIEKAKPYIQFQYQYLDERLAMLFTSHACYSKCIRLKERFDSAHKNKFLLEKEDVEELLNWCKEVLKHTNE